MLGIARQLARHGTPLVGINQGRLGFITDIAFGQFAEALAPILAGDYEEEHRSMLEGGVLARRRGDLRGASPSTTWSSAAARPPAWSS
jgi:NAD kinase